MMLLFFLFCFLELTHSPGELKEHRRRIGLYSEVMIFKLHFDLGVFGVL